MENFNQIIKILNLAFTFTHDFIQHSNLRARAYFLKLDTNNCNGINFKCVLRE